MDVSTSQLLEIIGRQYVELAVMRGQLATAENRARGLEQQIIDMQRPADAEPQRAITLAPGDEVPIEALSALMSDDRDVPGDTGNGVG